MAACPTEKTSINEEPLWTNGLSFHSLGLIIAAAFGGISVAIALFLVVQHAMHYRRPYEQKHVIRILMMIPIYALISFLSYYWYNYAVYWQVIRDCYEAFAIASFFTLLCHYIAPTLHEQKNYFRTATPKNWFWGVFGLQFCTGGENKGPFRKPRSGLTWFNIVWVGIFQYCLVRVLCTLMALITQLLGRYCERSLSPAYGHLWYQVLTALSVTVAMFCVVQFYIQTREDLAEHKPFLKVLCIKLVIFFSFWQQLVISFLASQYGPLQPTSKLNAPDIQIGIASVLICVEMAFFAIMHVFAFSWKPYSIRNSHDDALDAFGGGYGNAPKYVGGPLGIKAYLDAMNPWDFVKASARGFRWLFVGVRHRTEDPSYEQVTGKVGKMDGYVGPVYAGSGGAATELRESEDGRHRHGRTGGPAGTSTVTGEDDRTGLLDDSGTFGRVSTGGRGGANPSRYYTNQEYAAGDDSQLDLSTARPRHDYDTGYRGAQTQASVRPPTRPQEPAGHDPHWDMFGGATRPADAQSTRPPTYRSEDPAGRR